MEGAPRVLAARYVLGPVIGRGAFGIVYQATDQRSGRVVALKVLSAVEPARADRFQREVAALKALRHPHIVEVLDVGRGDSPGQVFFAMERLQGKTLSALCKDGPLAPNRAVRLTLHLLSALERAHALGIMHRDLKPGNLFVVNPGSPEETLKVLDFGLSRGIDAPSLTKTGEILGTPAYMAPEQARGQRVDARTDVYSAGGCLYSALAARAPIDGESPVRQVVRAMAGGVTPLLEVAPAVPAELAALVATAMSADPASRFASARAMREALNAWLAQREDDRTSRVLQGVVAASLLIAAFAGAYLAFSRPGPSPRPAATTPWVEESTVGVQSASPTTPLPATGTRAAASPRPQGKPAPAPATSFAPCSRDQDCGFREKCYPGGCGCARDAIRCGDRCRTPGRSLSDCGCGAVCKADEQCFFRVSGSAECKSCPGGGTSCGEEPCVDLQRNPRHCGACRHACRADQSCYQATCYDPVRMGERCISDGQCTDSLGCVDNVCKCRPGYSFCGGKCVYGLCD